MNSIAMESVMLADLDFFSHQILQCHLRGGSIYLFGNGGSASTASHAACDLSKGVYLNSRMPLRAISLNDMSIVNSAWSNDDCHENLFVNLIDNFVKPNDLLIAVSGSGNSENVVRAVSHSVNLGITTLALLGFDGGKVRDLPHRSIIIPSFDMQVVENSHLFIFHWLYKDLSESII
jgi:D-sedoheptulose 7-phosphate isomerase